MLRLLIIFSLITFNSQAQQMIHVKNGTVSLNDKLIKRPRQLKKVLELQNSQELMRVYRRYIRYKRSAQFFSGVASYGLFSAVEGEFEPNPKINWSWVGVAVGASVTAEFFHRPANRTLKEIVELYNGGIYFEPIRREPKN